MRLVLLIAAALFALAAAQRDDCSLLNGVATQCTLCNCTTSTPLVLSALVGHDLLCTATLGDGRAAMLIYRDALVVMQGSGGGNRVPAGEAAGWAPPRPGYARGAYILADELGNLFGRPAGAFAYFASGCVTVGDGKGRFAVKGGPGSDFDWVLMTVDADFSELIDVAPLHFNTLTPPRPAGWHTFEDFTVMAYNPNDNVATVGTTPSALLNVPFVVAVASNTAAATFSTRTQPLNTTSLFLGAGITSGGLYVQSLVYAPHTSNYFALLSGPVDDAGSLLLLQMNATFSARFFFMYAILVGTSSPTGACTSRSCRRSACRLASTGSYCRLAYAGYGRQGRSPAGCSAARLLRPLAYNLT